MSRPEDDAVAGEVWQEADNVLLLCVQPGVRWMSFGEPNVPWNASLIAHPMRRMLDVHGNLVPEYRAWVKPDGPAPERENEQDVHS